mmetsp:Transcript_24323/g.76321  ORF Transcript_24323/g.76321 Transcript_24323/m.76321 type:complete len:559 (-) Transcript_24323:96-1772(-)
MAWSGRQDGRRRSLGGGGACLALAAVVAVRGLRRVREGRRVRRAGGRGRGATIPGQSCGSLLFRAQAGHQRGGGAPARDFGCQFVADDGAKDGAVQQGVSPQPVVAMNATSHLPCRVQPGNDRAVVAQHRSICAHPDAAHRVVQHGHDAAGVQRSLLRRDWRVPEGRLAKGIHASLGCSVVIRERGVDGRLQRQSRPRVHRRRPRRRLLGSLAVGAFSISQHPASQGVRAVERDHQILAQVVLNVLARLGGHRLVEQQHKLGRTRLELGRHHLVPREQLVDEPLPLWREQHASHPAHHLAAQRLGGRFEVGGVEESRGVNLHLVHVYGARPDGHGHLHAIACCPWSICGREVNQVWPMLGEQRGVRPIVCEASRCEHRVMRGDETLLICGRVHVRYAGHTAGVRFRHQPLGAAAQHELELPFRLELLDLAQQRVGQLGSHWPAGRPVSPGEGVAAELRHLGQVHRRPLLEPLDGRARRLCQNSDQALGVAFGRLGGVLGEGLDRVVRAAVGARGRRVVRVDPRRRLDRVAARPFLLVHQHDVRARVEQPQGRAQAGAA